MITRHPVGRVRIRTHEYMENGPEPGSPYPFINGILPSFPDVTVSVINADGTETDIPGVHSVTWKVSANGEPAVALIEVHGAELQADADGVELVEVKS